MLLISILRNNTIILPIGPSSFTLNKFLLHTTYIKTTPNYTVSKSLAIFLQTTPLLLQEKGERNIFLYTVINSIFGISTALI